MIKQSIITIATLGLLTVTASAFDDKGCTGCHGAKMETSAMGKAKIIKDMSKADIETALKGYKDGSYGGPMKALMAAQASKMSEDDIKAFAEKWGK
jgi:cytochrome c-type protein NapB